MSVPGERLVRLGEAAETYLSVLIPFHRDNPSPLLARLAHAPREVELILLDDGSNDAALLSRVVEAAIKCGVRVRIIVWQVNRGRAAARNRLMTEAAGGYVLFLDADMLPDRASFLSCWLSVARCQQPDVAFGGLSVRHATRARETALHRNLFARSSCHGVAARQRAPAQTTATANLLVRRAFLQTHPFDAGFAGWGFEDTDWALAAHARCDILHVDNPATHAGLDSVETLLRKNAEAGPNFARLAAKHPNTVRRFAAHRSARAVRRAPHRPLRFACAIIAGSRFAPMPLRRAALKLHRVSHFAEHLP
jgi:hypothetical protein